MYHFWQSRHSSRNSRDGVCAAVARKPRPYLLSAWNAQASKQAYVERLSADFVRLHIRRDAAATVSQAEKAADGWMVPCRCNSGGQIFNEAIISLN